jgi:hypothetical protein
MRRFVNEVRKEQDKFAELIARETGKPLWEARTEVESVMAKVEISVGAYAERTGQRKLDSALQGTAAVRHKPHGVMVVLGPYNFPAHLPNGHIVPALIAGNVVILKPSEKTPAVGEFLIGCFHRAGIPAAVVQLLVGGPEQGQALVAHDGIDGVLFTGSAQVGVAINRKLAANPGKVVALEMGGNNPIVLWDTPKISDAAMLIVQSAFTSAGQRCTAARRLIVKASLYDQVIDELKGLISRIVIGAPFDEPAPFMGPVIDVPAGRPADRSVRLPDVAWRQADRAYAPPARELAVRDARTDRHHRDGRTARRRTVRATAAGRPRRRLRPGDSRGEQHPLRAVGCADRRHAAGLQPLLGQHPRGDRQLEPADQRRVVGGAVRRDRVLGKSPPGRVLRRRLLRLPGRQHRDGAAASEHRGRFQDRVDRRWRSPEGFTRHW